MEVDDNNEQENFIFNKKGIPDTNYFVYKSKNYPIKFDFFKHCSNYFQNNKERLKRTKYIQLVDDFTEKNTDFREDNIQDFINYVHCQKVSLKDDNVILLNYLSSIYEIEDLQKQTNEYILKHEEKLVLRIIFDHQNESSFDTSRYEEIISKRIGEFIDDELLIGLNIEILSRILGNISYDDINDDERSKIFNFLFKFLERNGRAASVLFSEINVNKNDMKHLEILIEKYSDVFDFTFINKTAILTMFSNLKEERTKHLKELHNIHREHQKEISYMKEEEEKQRQNIDKLKQNNEKLEQKNSDLIKTIEQLHDENKEKLEIIRNKEEEIQQTKVKIEQENLLLKNEISKYQRQQEEYKTKLKQHEQPKNELRQLKQRNLILFPFINENKFEGIISYLRKQPDSIKYTPSSVWRDNNQARNVSVFEDRNAIYISGDKPNSWICLDFQENQIIPTHYTIRTSNYIYSWYPKSWIFEGLTNNDKWITLDEEKDCEHLKGMNLIYTFQIQQQITTKFRCIRLRATGPNWHGKNFFVIDSLEIYGLLT